LRSCGENVPFLEIKSIEAETRENEMQPNLLAELELSGEKQTLVIEAKGSGHPRLARDAANQLLRYKERYPEAYRVFAAAFVSPKAAEVCSKEDIGYVDLNGNCRRCFDRIYIERQGTPHRFSEKRDLCTLYSPKAQRVLRVVLSNPKKSWNTKDLLGQVRLSAGQVSNIKKLLCLHLLDSRGRGEEAASALLEEVIRPEW